MKVMSINVNKFNDINEFHMGGILGYIVGNKPTVVFLNEFPINSSKPFIVAMDNAGYRMSHIKSITNSKNLSITVAFVNKEYSFAHIENTQTFNARVEIIHICDYILYGVHAPMISKYKTKEDVNGFWDNMIQFYKDNKDKKILLIGDLNVFDDGTPQKYKFNELMLEAIDLWVRFKNEHITPTFESGKRIDYAISSNKFAQEVCNIKTDHSLRYSSITDHSSIILEIS